MLEQSVYSYIKKHHMIEEGDTIIVGVSGGPDSICLFHLLLRLMKQIPFSMYVVHIHHGLRIESDQEEIFVEALCKHNEIPFHIFHEDVVTYAKTKHCSLEEAGRILRYRDFELVSEEICQSGKEEAKIKIAVAHNKNDQAETVLFHLFRGSGIEGLGGIAPVNHKIIRPLLEIDRSEIEKYLTEQDLGFCVDRTNEEDHFARNRIRHHILPFAEAKICEQSIAHISNTATNIQEVNSLLHQLVGKAKLDTVIYQKESDVLLSKETFDQMHIAIQKELIKEILYEVAGKRKDFSRTHILDVHSLFDNQVGKEISLPYSLTATRTYEGVKIHKTTEKKHGNLQDLEMYELKLGENQIPGIGKIWLSFEEDMQNLKIPEKKCTKWFDYDKIKKCLIARKRMPGDFFTITDAQSKKKIKEYLINEKVPREEREQMFFIADGQHIVWLIGRRISETYKVTEKTKKIIKIHIESMGEN